MMFLKNCSICGGTDRAAGRLSGMKEHRLKRPALAAELLMALAAILVAGMFAWYAVLIWRFFFD
jgi:hypothetical protein